MGSSFFVGLMFGEEVVGIQLPERIYGKQEAA
jgi:hypothetical protein